SDISLGAFNIPQGSVSVTAGGQVLQENVHYTIDYNLGRLKIIDGGILNSGVPVTVKFENNPAFVFNKKTLFATRLDYYINDQFKLGGTYMRLSERPYTRKLNVGEDPISNAIYGADMSWQRQSGWVTKMVDAIPLIDTKDPSTVTFTAEGARLDPGHSKAIGKTGTVYVDDFEGTQSTYDLKFPFVAWALSSTPTGGLFPEATLVDSLDYGFRRAKLQWYNIDPYFYTNNAPGNIRDNSDEQFGLYTRQIYDTDLFPQKPKLNQNGLPPVLSTFDLHFDPRLRGPYNFSPNLNDDGTLANNPTENWGGIMRSLDYNDFEAANIEFIQFWVMDPYGVGGAPEDGDKGKLYIQLGNISEDILKDSRLFFENALPPNGYSPDMQSSDWSFFPPQNQPPITNSFDNDANSRQNQDVGYDGAKLEQERTHFANFLNLISGNPAYAQIFEDPSNDNYRYYKDPSFDAANAGIIERYRDYNNPEGNSPVPQGNQDQSFAATNIPESEDLNRDNTLSETEEFFEYQFSLEPGDLNNGQNYITDAVTTQAKDADGNVIGDMTWYQVRIPLNEYVKRTGGIQDFKSIRFIRLFVNGSEDPVTLRFGKLELLRNQWRRYNFSLQSPGEYIPDDNGANTYFNVSSVSYEENGTKQPVNYVLPPGIEQEQTVGTVNQYLQNEQALSMQVCDLPDGDARAAYKNLNLDLRTFDSLKMHVHAERVIDQPEIGDRDITAFIRLGSDFVGNYYEYEIPVRVTPDGVYNNNSEADRFNVWPQANQFTIDLKNLTSIKQERNAAGASPSLPFTITVGTARVTLVGNPDLGLVKVAMLGVRNPKQGTGVDPDDSGAPICAEVWFNELRVSGFDEEGGYAALARADVKLADFGSVTLAGTMHTIGFGTLEQKLNERYKDNYFQYDLSTTLELSKFLPAKVGLRLPMYAGISRSFSNPKYDPYELDVLLKDKLALIQDKGERDSARRAAQNYTSIKSLNFTNVRRVSPNKQFVPKFFSIENFNATYAFTNTFRSNPIIQEDDVNRHHAELGYAFPGKSLFVQPFNKPFASRTGKYWKPIKDFNFNLLPTNLVFRTAYDRQYGQMLMRPRYKDDIIEPTYNKYFTNDRFYGAKLDLTRALSLDYSAVNNARIDEPYGKIDTKEEKDSIMTNLQKFGRNTHFHQTVNASYTLPFSKFPILDWVTGTAKYGADYDWLASPQVLDTTFNPDLSISRIRQVDNPLGNVIANGQNIALNGDLNIRNLYGKWKWLKRFDTNFTPPKATPTKPGAKGDAAPEKPKNENTGPAKPGLGTFGMRLITSLKKVNMSYTQNRSTTLPGFNYRSEFLGRNFGKSAPGFDFITGFQPDTSWLYEAADRGWITNDTSLNYQFIQTLNRTATLRATFEPARDFNIDINFNRTYTQNSNGIFRNMPEPGTTDPMFRLLNPQQYGTYSITYVALATAFQPSDSGYSEAFTAFSDYRSIISRRLQSTNPNSNGDYFNPVDETTNENYAAGYGPYSQDVLVPAFLAAYTGKDPNEVKLGNVFRKLPLPNWRIAYNGLGKLKWAKKLF
ncbi:MAG TPA: cell surface protein SprA, partial [Chitinophagales bacterium]|nr:cell surface protein SprA [Chitinophagales bacterium]